MSKIPFPNQAHLVSKMFILIGLFANLAGCAVELKDKTDDEKVKSVKVAGQTLFPLFQLEGPNFKIEAGDSPNDYKLTVRPPDGTVSTERTQRQGLIGTQAFSMANAFTDANVSLGETYEYKFIGEGFHEIGRVRVTLPIDLVVNAPLDFSKAAPGSGTDAVRRYRRVFLSPTAVLKSGAQDIELQAEEFYAAIGAKWMNLEADLVAAPKTMARKGGDIKLVLSKATGQLSLEMNGESGSAGSAGPDYAERAAQGLTPATQDRRDCENMQSGGAGAPGGRGQTGTSGIDGGHTGSFELVAEDASAFRIEKTMQPGKGGRGGDPGAPQLGGLGGLAESRLYQVYSVRRAGMEMQETLTPKTCLKDAGTNDGPEGAKGQLGEKAPDGVDGREGFYCLRGFSEICAQ